MKDKDIEEKEEYNEKILFKDTICVVGNTFFEWVCVQSRANKR